MKFKVYFIKNRWSEDNSEDERNRYLKMAHPLSGEKQPKPRKEEYKLYFQHSLKVMDIDNNLDKMQKLEEIFKKFQNEFKPDVISSGRSMMVGDLVELDGELFIVKSVGFNKTNWEGIK